MTLQELQKALMELAEEKGFGTSPDEINVGEKFAMIHSEVTEAYEAYRKKQDIEIIGEELSDVIQRVVHLAGILDIDIQEALKNKLAKSHDRELKWEDYNESHT